MGRGFFITFEGLDGSGKTTQLKRLATRLRDRDLAVTTLRQPGGTALGDRIRAVLVDSSSDVTIGAITPLAELALMFADRAQAIAEIIGPGLAAGDILLCDRFTDSSEAYQGAGRGLGREAVLAMHQTICGDLQPDLTILLLPPLEASLRRARRRNLRHLEQQGMDENRFERESDLFYKQVHQAYEGIAQREPERVVMIANDSSIDAIEVCVAAVVDERLAGHVLSA